MEFGADRYRFSVYTFGDSILDCGRYNVYGVNPGQLLVHNDDRLFPEFPGRDLSSLVVPARLIHRAQDGAIVESLSAQAHGLHVEEEATRPLATIASTFWTSSPPSPGRAIAW